MKKLIALVFMIFILCSNQINLFAQSSKIDSLENLLQSKVKNDTLKIRLLNELSALMFKEDFKKAYNLAHDGLRLSEQIDYTYGLAESNKNIAYFYLNVENFALSIDYYLKAYELYKKLGNKQRISICLNNIGVINKIQGNISGAIEYYQKALKIREETSDIIGIYSTIINIGNIYYTQRDFDKAIEYYQKALIYRDELNSNERIPSLLNNIGAAYNETKEYNKALDYAKEGLDMCIQYSYLNEISRSLSIIGNAHYKLKHYSISYDYFTKALEYALRTESKMDECDVYIMTAQLLLSMDNPLKAYEMSKLSYDISKNTGSLFDQKRSKEVLTESCRMLGLYKEALNNQSVFIGLKDSIINEQNIKELTTLENRYKFDKEKQHITAEQDKKNAIQAADMKRQKQLRNGFIGGSLMFLILAIIILRNLIQKRKANILLAKQKEEIVTQSEELLTTNDRLLELDQFKQGMTGMIVHDLKNPLNSIINLSKDIQAKQSGKQMLNMVLNILDVHKYEETQFTVDKVDYSLYELSQNAILEVEFLAKQKNITISNTINSELGVNCDKEIIERVFVNLLTNAIKYTPNNGSMTLSSIKDSLGFVEIKVADSGEGIPADKQAFVFNKFGQVDAKDSGRIKSTGLGLTFCKMAIEAHGGKIGVVSEVEQGTTFTFTLPVAVHAIAVSENQIKEQIKSDFEFSVSDKEQLKSYIQALNKLMVYQTSSIEKIISDIDSENNEAIQYWLAEVRECLFAMNEEKYKELIRIVEY